MKLASDATATIKAKGEVNIASQNITLKNTLYVPELRTNLISVAKIVDAGYSVKFDKQYASIADAEGKIRDSQSKSCSLTAAKNITTEN